MYYLFFQLPFDILNQHQHRIDGMQKKAYFHSPFSEITVLKGTNRFLLVQFILTEIFQSAITPEDYFKGYLENSKTTSKLTLSIFLESSPFTRLQEHAKLLPFAFPKKKVDSSTFSHVLSLAIHIHQTATEKPAESKDFEAELQNHLRQMIFLLEPFIEECKNDESFLFFLLNRHKEMALISYPGHLYSLLSKLHPKGLDSLQEHICDYFHEKGFSYLIPEVKSLVELIKQPSLIC